MKTLRTIYFFPAENRLEEYITEDGFNRSVLVSLTSLPEPMQQIAESAMQWLSAQMPAGFEDLQQVILERKPDVVLTQDEESNPTATSPAFNVSVTGTGDKGEATISIQSAPGAVTDATAVLWDHLASQI